MNCGTRDNFVDAVDFPGFRKTVQLQLIFNLHITFDFLIPKTRPCAEPRLSAYFALKPTAGVVVAGERRNLERKIANRERA